MKTLEFQALETRFEVRTDCEAALVGLSAVWQSCCSAPVPARNRRTLETRRERGEVRILLDGEHVDTAAQEMDVLPQLDRVVYAEIGRSAQPGRTLLHAASLVCGDVALLVAGPSGAGKSSLAWEGVVRGLRYAGDEIAVSDGERLWGISRAIQYDPTFVGDPLPHWVVGADTESYRFVHAEGRPCFMPLRRPPADRLAVAPVSAERAIVVLAQRDHETHLSEASPLEALEHLYRDRWGDPRVAPSKLVRTGRCYRLSWESPASAWDALLPLVA